MKVSDMELSPACSMNNYLHDGIHCEAHAPLLLLRITWDAKSPRLPPGAGVGWSAAMG